ncbi:GGDEF domain-containing protein [Arenibacterium sp. CAU 1754]
MLEVNFHVVDENSLMRSLQRYLVFQNRKYVFWFSIVTTVLVLTICNTANFFLMASDTFAKVFWVYNAVGSAVTCSVTYLMGLQMLKVFNLTKQLKHMVNHDQLTGLNTRSGFFRAVEARGADRAVVIAADIDRFKVINDTYGHNVGDQVLVEFARRLMRDCRGDDVVARFGGEEFIVYLPCTRFDNGAGVAERLRKVIAHDPVETQSGLIDVTASFGVAESAGGQTIDQHIQKADAALYLAKANGRNCVERALPVPRSQAKRA